MGHPHPKLEKNCELAMHVWTDSPSIQSNYLFSHLRRNELACTRIPHAFAFRMHSHAMQVIKHWRCHLYPEVDRLVKVQERSNALRVVFW